MPKVYGATVINGASPGSTRRGTPFYTTNIPRRWPQAAAKKNAMPATSPAIAKGDQRPTEDRDGTRAPAEEQLSVPYKGILRGARRRGLVKAALVPKYGDIKVPIRLGEV